MGRFESREYGEEREWEYGLDWQERFEERMSEEGETVEEQHIWLVVEEGYEQELNEENCMIFINATEPELNAIAIIDNRDGNAWWWFNGTHDNFQEMFLTVMSIGCHIGTNLPKYEVERNFNRIAEHLGKRAVLDAVYSSTPEVDIDSIVEIEASHIDEELDFYLDEWDGA